jgi:integrase/recombinase XerD
MIKISLVFDHRNRTAKGEEGPVEVRVTVNRKPYYINTGVCVRKDRLVGNCLRDDATSNDADMLNERLTTIVAIVEKEVNKCLEARKPISVADIRTKVWDLAPVADDAAAPTIVRWIEEYTRTANIANNTRLHYLTVARRLLEFGKMVRWDQLTVDNIYAWDVWLRHQEVPLTKNQKAAGMEPQLISSDSVYNYHKYLKATINKAMKFQILTANPYDQMKGMFKRTKRDVVDYLTEAQMKKVMALTPVPGSQAALALDLFIFQMFTGLGYADTQIFDISQYRNIDGKWMHIGQRVKTGVPYVSQLLPPVVEVLERNGWHVPKMANQRYNQMLKAIGMVIGIENLHSHMGRHTFATYMLSNGAKIENVSRMLGHTNITQTQRYAKVLAKDVHDDFDKIAKKLKSKK